MPLASISSSEECAMTLKIQAMLTVLMLATSAPLLAVEMVVVVNPKNPATRMFGEQAAQFFVGKSTMFTPVDQSDGSAIREEFYKKVVGKDPSSVKAIWSKLVFTGKGSMPIELRSTAEVKKAVAADPSAIGYIEKSAVDDTVKVVFTVP
jgi:ABC-type phosphate transport system substrate-binding protein